MQSHKEKIGVFLKRKFDESGLTVGQVCLRLGVSADSFRVTLSRNRFSAGMLLKLAKIVGLPEDLAVLQNQFEFTLTTRSSARVQYPVNIMPLIKAIAETNLAQLSLEDLYYLLNLQKNFTGAITPSFIEESMRLR